MYLYFTEEQKAIRDTVRKFARNEVAPRAEELDRTGEFPYDLVQRSGELGIIGLFFPEDIGGTGADTISWILAMEELAWADMSLAVTIFCSAIPAWGIYTDGTEDLKQRFLPAVIKGEGLGAGALTEPDAGSDNRSMKTTALLDGDEFVINGTKCFITNPGTDISAFVNLFCRVDTGDNRPGTFGSIIVPAETPGFTISKAYRKMGWRSSSTRELSFEDCRVPSSHLLFKTDTNLTSLIRDMYLGRISLAATSIGLGQACYDHSLKYAQERVQFGKPIGKFQRVQDMLVDMHVELEAAKVLNYKAGFLRDQGEYPAAHTAASMAKYYGTEAAKRAADRAVQIHGGYGFMDEYPVSRYYRDIRVATIGDGTSEIQRSIIAKSLGC